MIPNDGSRNYDSFAAYEPIRQQPAPERQEDEQPPDVIIQAFKGTRKNDALGRFLGDSHPEPVSRSRRPRLARFTG